ncbi:Nucleoside diphosphate kinase-like domain [Dillenia turbinata]|uniref:Nucleoside diphosphate kinase n=1 Tax=Dillenia turbinata TaxID=194707 RepID=A0AAN8USK4_9MAGN
MEAMAILGAGSPCVSSTQLHSRTKRHVSLFSHHQNLSFLNPQSRLFSPALDSKTSFLKAGKHFNKPHIFLPHFVAAMEEVEETYIMVKPDGVQRGLVGEIISRFEKKGFKLTGLKLFQCPKDLAEEHYKDLKGKSFFPKLIDYITSGPVVCMAWEGIGVVASARKVIGATNPLNAEPGTIRGDLAVQTGRNVVHGSDSPENGKREIGKISAFLFSFLFSGIGYKNFCLSEELMILKFHD